jgi:hypothetical protein
LSPRRPAVHFRKGEAIEPIACNVFTALLATAHSNITRQICNKRLRARLAAQRILQLS